MRRVVDGLVDPTPVLDLSDRVVTNGDMGLVGLALDPAYDANGWIYLAWVEREPGRPTTSPTVQNQRVSRFTVVDGTADPASEKVLVGGAPAASCEGPGGPRRADCLPAVGNGHTVDDLLFDPEGHLFVSIGDGLLDTEEISDNVRAQDLDTAVGKVLRIDPATGRGLPGNPFWDASAPVRTAPGSGPTACATPSG